jgi:hypothetical protein
VAREIEFYRLQVIVAVRYRVKSARGIDVSPFAHGTLGPHCFFSMNRRAAHFPATVEIPGKT